MTVTGWIQILLYCLIIVALTPLLGAYMTRVFGGERTFLSPVLRPVELAIYKIGGVNEQSEQHAVTYTIGMLLFHVGGFVFLYALMRFQALLPFNPADQSAVVPDLSFNAAVSFITNTNWQAYGGESTMSYLVQMLGLTHQNYLSAATGIVLAIALIRGFTRHSVRTAGNFWVDITRCTLYVLIPICVPYALFLIWQGMPQTLGPYVDATTLEGAKQLLWVRSPLKLRSRCSAPTAAAFSMLMPHTRSKIRRPFQFRADPFHLRARRSVDQRLRPNDWRSAARVGYPRRHGRAVYRRCYCGLCGRGPWQ